jgi:hypothetical protein
MSSFQRWRKQGDQMSLLKIAQKCPNPLFEKLTQLLPWKKLG